MHFDEDKFTAYALGELDAKDVGPVEAQLSYDQAARQYVDDVRAAAGLLTRSLQGESDQTLTARQHGSIERQLRANRAASTGLPAVAVAPLPLSDAPAVESDVVHTTLEEAPPLTLAAQSSELADLQRRRSLVVRRARRYDRAVLALSFAASISIICLGLAALLIVLKDRRPVASLPLNTQANEAPYLVQHRPPPAQQTERPSETIANRPLDPSLAVPPADPDGVGTTLAQADDVSPQSTEESADSGKGVVAPVVPLESFRSVPSSSVRSVRSGLVRRASDVPRLAKGPAPVHLAPAPFFTSPNPAVVPPLTPSVAPTKIDPALDLTRFDDFKESELVSTASQPFSSFAATADSASYVVTRRFIAHNYFPPPQAVRVEEMLNYFPWKTPAPTAPDSAFASTIEVAACPWNVEHRLARIALKAREITPEQRPPVNLVLLVDLSAQMRADDKLPLLKKSLKLLLGQLGARDRLSIVGASQNAWFFLPPTAGDDHHTIAAAIDRLQAAGPAGSAPGIEAAYYAAAAGFASSGVNRVLLATDGAWSAALTDPTSITKIIEEKARTQNISLGVLALGGPSAATDIALRRLAAAGNGSYLPIDSLAEAHKTLVDQADGSLLEIARDVSVRVEFEPATAESYRLIGYESHLLPAADFDDAVIDGASIGAGHEMTALYEIVPTLASRRTDAPPTPLLTLSVHYNDPVAQSPSLLKFVASDRPVAPSKTSNDFKFAAAVTEFSMLLRDNAPRANVTWANVLDLAQQGRGPDEAGYRQEFIELVKKAKALTSRSR